MSLKFLLFALVLGNIVGFRPYVQENTANVEIQVSYIDSSLIKIQWCQSGDNEGTVIVLTSKGSVYRSDDKGINWIKMSEVFHRKGLAELNDSDKDRVGIVNNIVGSVAEARRLIYTGTESISWLSADCGHSITAISNYGQQLREFQFHSTNSDFILASSWKQCNSISEGVLDTRQKEKTSTNCHVYKELMMSENGGLSWHSIASYINQFQWAPSSPSTPENRIFVSFEASGKGNQALSSWNTDTSLYYSDNFFETRELLVNAGARFMITPSYMFVAKVTNAVSKEISLLISQPYSALGYQFDVIDADENLMEHSYTVLDTAQIQVFMIVSHLKVQSPVGVIYISDSTGTRYSKSLLNAVRVESGAEFHRVQGLDGIYLANVYNDEQAKLYEDSIYESRESGFGTSSQSFKDEDLQKYKQSRITFDKGSNWITLNAPTLDSTGKAIKCEKKVCSLHLHLNQAIYQYGPIYSRQSAIGLIIATGSVGKYLSYRTDQVNTYLSRDGGLNWYEIQKGSHIYEISDHGGLIVMASDQTATKNLIYSWNEGLNWSTLEFSDQEIEVTNIITEPSERSTRFIVYGSTQVVSNGQNLEQGVIITVDLDELHQRKCLGTDKPGDVESDYELWSPSGVINPDCLFGRKITYMRRKREAQCYNTEQFDRVVSVEPCICKAEDYECDIGFKRDTNQQCVIQNKSAAITTCKGSYTVSNGYRRIAGNQCQGGLQFVEVKLRCPGDASQILDYLILAFIFLAMYWGYNNQDKLAFLFARGTETVQIKSDFQQIRLEDNEKGLGYREFDEDLIESAEISYGDDKKVEQSNQTQDYDEDQLL